MFKMAFQVVELTIDADNTVIERKVGPYRYLTHGDAVAAIEIFVSAFSSYGHEETGNFWWAVAKDGKIQVRFIIESV
jgi:hypothetical protein